MISMTNTMTTPKTVTLRLPEDLYHAGNLVAQKRHMSMNALLKESLEARLKEIEDEEMYEAFTLVGQDKEESDVEFAFFAQAEVVLNGE
jgi:predicted DNA-binding protein